MGSACLAPSHESGNPVAFELEHDIDDARRRLRHEPALLDPDLVIAYTHVVVEEARQRPCGHTRSRFFGNSESRREHARTGMATGLLRRWRESVHPDEIQRFAHRFD